MHRILVMVFAGLSALALGPSAHAAAASGPRGNVVVLDGRTVIAEGQLVNNVVVFHGQTIVDGIARGSVVVLDGPTTISGDVHGSVVVFRGHVEVAPGAHIGGDLVTGQEATVAKSATIDGKIKHVSGINLTGYNYLFRFLVWLAYTISVLVLGLLMVALLPGPMESAGLAAKSIGASIGWGFAILFGLPVAAVVVMVTLVGIPLGLSLLLALWFLFTLGYTVGAFAIGRMLVKPPRGRMKAFFAGWGIARVAGLIPVLGGLAWTAVALFGLGSVCVAVWRSRRAVRDDEQGAPAPALPPMAPAPPPPA
jgi:cytoskeletal protein CcmA (bactofilin family)